MKTSTTTTPSRFALRAAIAGILAGAAFLGACSSDSKGGAAHERNGCGGANGCGANGKDKNGCNGHNGCNGAEKNGCKGHDAKAEATPSK